MKSEKSATGGDSKEKINKPKKKVEKECLETMERVGECN